MKLDVMSRELLEQTVMIPMDTPHRTVTSDRNFLLFNFILRAPEK